MTALKNFRAWAPYKKGVSYFPPTADAYVYAQAIQHQTPLCILTQDGETAQRLQAEILSFAPQRQILLLPDWETLVYERFSAHQALISQRLKTLYRLDQADFDVLVVPITTALQKIAPKSFIQAYTFIFQQGHTLSRGQLERQLQQAGYTMVQQVLSPGEYSIRGGLIDLFPMGSIHPYRLDLFDDEIETIYRFDPDSQRTTHAQPEVLLLPAREFPTDSAGCMLFRKRFRQQFEGDPSKVSMYGEVGKGIFPPGIEYYLPLFFEQTSTLFEYLPPQTLLSLHAAPHVTIEPFWQDLQQRYRDLSIDSTYPLLPPDALFLSHEDFSNALTIFERFDLRCTPPPEGAQPPTADQPTTIKIQACATPSGKNLPEKIKQLHTEYPRVIISLESAGRQETIQGLLNAAQIETTTPATLSQCLELDTPASTAVMLSIGQLHTGFCIEVDGQPFCCLVTEAELYERRIRQPSQDNRSSQPIDSWVRDLSELEAGDAVVHIDHGIGRYCGLKNMDVGYGETEFLVIEYAKADRLYLPITQLHVISRYCGGHSESALQLHRLGSTQWEKAKRKAKQQIRDSAAELLQLYALRQKQSGQALPLEAIHYDAFCAQFPFETTPDQQRTIDEVIKDLCSPRPMDRLVCGDVGFGKTEVALRAAFVAIMAGKQVALLCPTTLLAEQHFQTFQDRFSAWPVKLAELSRFCSPKAAQATLAQLQAGTVDMVIGTHRLIQKDIQFARLGLMIIDEEHRFGVMQKEQLKKRRVQVDVLALTATPIPRSLSLAMEGIRDFSVISTAPQKRLSIKTLLCENNQSTIRDACLRELKRGGQVYFLYNDVKTISNMYDQLHALVPEARIVVGHGQMPERSLEQVMRDFTAKRYNILLCTTIIETGIDNPNANTILIHRADKFGLAQLHQLRGRVGRSHHQAYAYLLLPEADALSKDAQKRLEAIQAMEELGAGFYLALHDLEIRGAGEILGQSQSGEIREIGLSLYSQMLDSTVKAMKNGQEPDDDAFEHVGEINLNHPALLPTTYCPDVNQRLSLYKRLASLDDLNQLLHMREELRDRFGALPPATEALLLVHRLRILAQAVDLIGVHVQPKRIVFEFRAQPRINTVALLRRIQSDPAYQLISSEKVAWNVAAKDHIDSAQKIEHFMHDIRLEGTQ